MSQVAHSNGEFFLMTPMEVVKTISVTDQEEGVNVLILKSGKTHYVTSVHTFRGEVTGPPNTANDQPSRQAADKYAAEVAAMHREILKARRADRLQHKQRDPDYTGPYDGYRF